MIIIIYLFNSTGLFFGNHRSIKLTKTWIRLPSVETDQSGRYGEFYENS